MLSALTCAMTALSDACAVCTECVESDQCAELQPSLQMHVVAGAVVGSGVWTFACAVGLDES